MKKILIGMMALALSSLAFASGDTFVKAPQPNYFNGLYAGLAAGVAHTTGNITNDTTDIFAALGTLTDGVDTATFSDTITMPTKLDSDVGDTAFSGQVFVGFGKTFTDNSQTPKFYLGGELFGQYTPTKINAESSSAGLTENGVVTFDSMPIETGTGHTGLYATSIEVKNNYAIGGAIRAGFLVSPKTMVYILGGVKYANFKTDVDYSGTMDADTATDGTPAIQGPFSYSDSHSCNKIGFMPGVGIETMLTDNLSLRAQYTYTFYGKYSVDGGSVAADTGSTVIDYDGGSATFPTTFTRTGVSDTEVKLSQGEFTLGLTYHFSNIAI